MPPKKKVQLNESQETNLIWTDDEVQLLLGSIKFQNSKSMRK